MSYAILTGGYGVARPGLGKGGRARIKLGLQKKGSKTRTRTVLRRAQRGYMRVGGYYGRFGQGQENKFLDTVVNTSLPAATGSIINAGTINVIPQGDTQSQREGRIATITSIQFRMRAILASAAEASPEDSLRIIVYLDQQCNGATATVAQILQTTSFLSPYNLENSGRFRILYDKVTTYNVTAGATTAYNTPIKYLKWYKKCNIPIVFDNTATTGAIATIRTNNIGVMMITESALMSVDQYYRLRFYG